LPGSPNQVIHHRSGQSHTTVHGRLAPKATVDDHPYFSPLTHRGGRIIGTDTVGILRVLRVSSDDQEREQGGQDNPNVNAHFEQLFNHLVGAGEQPAGLAGRRYATTLRSIPKCSGSNLPPVREDRSTLPIENQAFVNSGDRILSLHFLFHDLTQYQE
jgi:hypothetical protein